MFKLLFVFTNPKDLEKTYVLISCEIGEEESLYSQLKKIPEVTNCLITYGNYDVVAEFETQTNEEMNECMASKIRKLKKIRSTVTLRVTASSS